jgi:hypothetical protein
VVSRSIERLWQTQPKSQKVGVLWRAQAGDRIPTSHGGEARGAAVGVGAILDVGQGAGVGVEDRVDEADGALAGCLTGLVDESDDRTPLQLPVSQSAIHLLPKHV